MNFIQPYRKLFTDLNDSQTEIFVAERTTIVKSIRCTNKSGINIRLNLKAVALLENPIQEAFLAFKCLVLANQSIDLLAILYGQSSEVVEHLLLNGDGLVLYSDDFSHKFDCVFIAYEETELNDAV